MKVAEVKATRRLVKKKQLSVRHGCGGVQMAEMGRNSGRCGGTERGSGYGGIGHKIGWGPSRRRESRFQSFSRGFP